jgi:hypothetical protein
MYEYVVNMVKDLNHHRIIGIELNIWTFIMVRLVRLWLDIELIERNMDAQ